jgi:hypothetical protein
MLRGVDQRAVDPGHERLEEPHATPRYFGDAGRLNLEPPAKDHPAPEVLRVQADPKVHVVEREPRTGVPRFKPLAHGIRYRFSVGRHDRRIAAPLKNLTFTA